MSDGLPDRYGTTIAPGGLGLVHRLLNTVGAGTEPSDLLADVPAAQGWLDEALTAWAQDTGRDAPAIELTPHDVPRIRALRQTVHETLVARAVEPASPVANPRVTALVDVELSPDGLAVARPRGRGAAAWLRSAVLAECLTAQIAGTWPRLKVCANPVCPVSFYDRSRNRSGAWHDVRICGNLINLRASRARRRLELER